MSEHRSTFPRGLVLGLTMAETAVLIIFVLLLALTSLLAREKDRRQAAEHDLERFEEAKVILAQQGLDLNVEELLRSVSTSASDRRAADNWRELVRSVEREVPYPSPEAIISQLSQGQEIRQLLDDAGLQPTSDAMNSLAPILRAVQESELTADDVREAIGLQEAVMNAFRESGSTAKARDVLNLVRDAEHWKSRIAQFEEQRGGRGTDHPSCWYDADRSVAYLFDIALRDDGFVIRTADAPQHQHKRASLPLAGVVTGRILTKEEFLAQTRPVFQWSVREDCRFFVRAFDLTASNRKDLYKARMRTLESRFYKNANPSGTPPTSVPARLAQ